MAALPSDAVAVSIGAVFGAISRYQAGRMATEWIAADPKLRSHWQGWHTAAINVGGSFILGVVTGVPLVSEPPQPASKFALSPRAKLLLGVGFCGSFTTFSTYSIDVATWMAQGQTTRALSYIMTNNAGGVMAAAMGLVLVQKLFGRR